MNTVDLHYCKNYSGRMIVLDTETTGLQWSEGHKLIEIGCVEIVNNKFTGRSFQRYINPNREVSAGAYRVTGLNNQFLKDKPLFEEIVEDFLDFIGDDILIIHNAKFDVPFINYELKSLQKNPLVNPVLDTLIVSREIFIGQQCNLDAVCNRLNIDRSARSFHGALLDAHILSKVYLSLLQLQKNQSTIDIFMEEDEMEINNIGYIKRKVLDIILVSEEELNIHNNWNK
jgi:DNA polymerase-3 subunit epsilon